MEVEMKLYSRKTKEELYSKTAVFYAGYIACQCDQWQWVAIWGNEGNVTSDKVNTETVNIRPEPEAFRNYRFSKKYSYCHS